MNRLAGVIVAAAMTGCAGQEPAPKPALTEVEQLPSLRGLPDVLMTLDGKKVASREEWESIRKPELKQLLQHYMYGTLPPARTVTVTVRRVDPAALGGKATLREVSLAVAPPPCPPIELLFVVPNVRRAPAPVFVGLNFTGNHTLLDDPKIALPTCWFRDGKGVKNNRATDEGRGMNKATWSIEPTIDRGYAVATFCYGDGLPDKPDFKDGIYPHVVSPEPGPTDVRAIAFWAWTVHRAVDFLVTAPEVDPKRIAVHGHSRNGKAALVAAAFDERIALAVPHQAGCGGTAPSRTKNPKGETVKAINDRFPHWFNAHFKKFNADTSRIPFDQHALLALCAPRAVLYTNGIEDQWADPAGQFEMMQAASPVWKLYGSAGLEAAAVPPLGELSTGSLGYLLRKGPHVADADYWRVFLDYADRQLGKP